MQLANFESPPAVQITVPRDGSHMMPLRQFAVEVRCGGCVCVHGRSGMPLKCPGLGLRSPSAASHTRLRSSFLTYPQGLLWCTRARTGGSATYLQA